MFRMLKNLSKFDNPIHAVTKDREPTKKALLVGVNKYGPGFDLRGCVNDVQTIWNALVRGYGFSPDNVRVLTDERATKGSILMHLRWLVDAVPGDAMVFSYSGHGAQIRDLDGDEFNDDMDEVLVPFDNNWDDPLTDDDLALMFKVIPDDARLTMLADCCHSGTVSRNFVPPDTRETTQYLKEKVMIPPFDLRMRSEGRRLPTRYLGIRDVSLGESPDPDVFWLSQRHVLFAGCRDAQTSADAYLEGKYQGALTAALYKAIVEKPDRTWLELHERVKQIVQSGGFSQVPQLCGNPDDLKRRVFA